jgi:hypothetical protein
MILPLEDYDRIHAWYLSFFARGAIAIQSERAAKKMPEK